MKAPILLIAGVTGLSDQLNSTGLFQRVIDVNSTNELLNALKVELGGIVSSDIIFFIGDNISSESPDALSKIIAKLTNNNFRVVIVTITPYGADLQRQNPRASILNMPININSVLFALKNFGYKYEPIGENDINSNISQLSNKNSNIDNTKMNSNTLSGWTAPTASPVFNKTDRDNKDSNPASISPPQIVPQRDNNNSGLWPTNYTPPNSGKLTDIQNNENTGNDFNTGFTIPKQPPRTPPVLPPRVSQPTISKPAWSNPESIPSPAYGSPAPRERFGQPMGQQTNRKGYVMTVSVSKGGVGKSSLSLNLAAYLGLSLKKFNKNVCVIDANLQQADSGKYLDTFSPNILDIARDPSLLTYERINEVLVYKEEYNISVLLGPHNPESGNPELITPRRYVEILEILKKKFDYIIIDTPVAEMYHPLFSEFALPKSDYLIVPVAPNYTTLLNADSWLDRVVTAPTHVPGGMGINPNNVGIVLNMAEEDIGCSEDDVRRTLARWQFIGSIPYSKEWKRANNLFELVAPKNYHDISQAFAEILYSATHDPDLSRKLYEPTTEKNSRFSKLFKRGK